MPDNASETHPGAPLSDAAFGRGLRDSARTADAAKPASLRRRNEHEETRNERSLPSASRPRRPATCTSPTRRSTARSWRIARSASKLGFDAAWLLEHHFSDYYPTPSPLLFMAHIAAAFPDLSLGTSVLVLPWYHPLRLAEEIAMLNSMTRGTLHLGIGRGTARMEYDAYNVDMNEARARFAECYRIVEKGLSGEPFTHDGTLLEDRAADPPPARAGGEEGALLRRHRQPGQRRGDGRSRRGADLPLDLPRQAADPHPRALAGAGRRRGAGTRSCRSR